MPARAFPWAADLPARLEAALGNARRVFVLGIGMDWKSDDRLGNVLARALDRRLPASARARVRVVAGGEAPENFTGAARAFAPSHVLLLDAVDHALAPGTAFLAAERDIAVGDMTSHHLPLKLLMRFLARSLPCRVVLLGVQPGTLAPGTLLSAPVRRTIAPLAMLLAAEIAKALPSTNQQK
jgi:hydrogenase maturation protease